MRYIEGHLSATGLRFAIIVSRFNHTITKRLLDGAIDCLLRHGADEKEISVVWVPGSFEIPLVAKKMGVSGKYDAIVCLGTIIRGETAHFEYVSAQTASGIMHAGLDTGIPTIFSVLTTENIEQAEARSGTKAGNVGFNNALNAIEMANLVRKLS